MNGKKTLVYSLTFTIVSSALIGALFFLNSHGEEEHSETEHSHAHHHDHAHAHSHEHHHDHVQDHEIAENEDHDHDEDDHHHEVAHTHDHNHGHSHGHHHHHSHETVNVVKLDQDQIKKLNLKYFIAGPQELNVKIDAKGKVALRPDGLAHVLAKTAGTAYEVKKGIGDWVQKDEILAVLESQAVAELKANYLAALNQERLTQSIYQREHKLFNKGISCNRECQAAKADYEEAKIQTKLSLQKLYSIGLSDQEIEDVLWQKERHPRLLAIRSPMEGMVTNRHFTKGEFVNEMTQIFEIVDPRTLQIEIAMYPKEVVFIKEGMPIKATSTFGDLNSGGTVTYISPIINDDLLSTLALAKINNAKGDWKPGMFVNVEIFTNRTTVPLAAPVKAIQTVEGKHCLFVHNDKGFEKRFVVLGQTDGENIEILKGVELGENCVSSNALLIKAEMGKNSIEHEH